MSDNPKIAEHWGSPAWTELFVEYLDKYVRADESEEATLRSLSGLDQFHAGGLVTTEKLLQMMRLPAAASLTGIDIGSGLGGPARWFAHKLGCTMQGYDLTKQLVAIADRLTGFVDMEEQCSFRVGDACALSYERTYDFAIMMAVSCNISNRLALYRSIRSVLKPGSILGVMDIVKGRTPGLYTPVPWSVDGAADTNLLLTQAETIRQNKMAFLELKSLQDVSAIALHWFQKEDIRLTGGKILGWEHVLPQWPAMVKAQIRNLQDDHIRFQCMVFTAV